MKRLLFFLALLASPLAAQTVTPISALPSASTPLAGTEVIPIVQSGATKKVTAAAIATVLTQTANTWVGKQTLQVANTTPATDGGNQVFQNSSTTASGIYHLTIPGTYNFADNVRSVIRNDNQSGGVQHQAAYGAYVLNSCAWGVAPHECNAVGYFAQITNNVATAHSWPINTACNDNTYASSCGNEHDVTVQSTGAVYCMWCGIIQGSVQPLTANGIQLAQVAGQTAQWTYGFSTGSGAAITFASIGALSASGTNIASQPVYFNGFDGAAAAYAFRLQAANHAMNFTDDTLPDGVFISAGTTNAIVGATGASTNIALHLSGQGTGQVVVDSDISAPAHSLTGATSLGAKLLALTPTTYASLPTCNSAGKGTMAYITDASAAITTWHQVVSAGGGANPAYIACNGSAWNAFSY